MHSINLFLIDTVYKGQFSCEIHYLTINSLRIFWGNFLKANIFDLNIEVINWFDVTWTLEQVLSPTLKLGYLSKSKLLSVQNLNVDILLTK